MVEKKKKNEKARKLQKVLRGKKHKPSFRGRWGKKSIRRVSNKKWQKWRKPRGIDIDKKNEDGAWPSPGYGTPRAVKHLHPSGFQSVIVHNVWEVQQLKEGQAARIAGTVGAKKREAITVKAEELGIKVLNG
ncbi:MAG: eL32 family ribosomal protein [Candidatus Diapherotrites archaeon]